MKGMWVGYGVGCTMRLTLGHGAWQIDQPSNGSMWNSYSFQPVGQWMGYSFTDLGAEGCCRSLNALLKVFLILWKNEMESPIFLHDKYDLYDVCFHLNIYTATFLFDWWLLCWPEIWHWIFLPIQVSQYVLWDHNVKLPNPIAWPYNVVN